MTKSKPTLYSLHVGINDYASDPDLSNLDGCVNDAKKLKAFVEKHFSEDYHLKSKLLLNQQATYGELVAHLGELHLGKAEPGDLVFFTYSGHGSKERSAAAFKDPGGKGETLVCYDSRPNGKDLADKELAVLMQGLEEKGAYIVTLLDCCHSGSGFRSDDAALGKARQCYDREEERPLETYLDGHYKKLKDANQPVEAPNFRQLNLAACDRSEKAYEHGTHGLFTFCLLEVLKETPRLSYAKLFERCRRMMAGIADRQHPRFEPTGHFDSYEVFLRPGNRAEEIRHQLEYKMGKWYINMGSLHGVPASSDVPVSFAVFKKNETSPIGYANALEVDFQETILDFTSPAENEYDAKLISLPDPGLEAFMDKNFAKRLKEIQASFADVKPVYTTLNETDKTLKYALEYEPGQIIIRNQLTEEIVKGFKTFKGKEEEHNLFKIAFKCLDDLAQWERMLALEKSSEALLSDQVKFDLIVKDQSGEEIPIKDPVTVELYGQDGVFEKVPAKVQLSNPYPNDKLHYCLLELHTDYSVASLANGIVKKKEEGLDIYKNDLQLDDGEREYIFYLKLIVSTEVINIHLFELLALKEQGEVENIDTRGGFASRNKKKAVVKDWYVKTMKVHLRGIDRAINDKQDISLEAGKIKILSNKKISANASTTVTGTGNYRSAGWLNVLPRLFDEESVSFFQPAAKTRSEGDQGAVVLKLDNLTGAEHISENPIRIEVNEKLKKNEILVPITFVEEQIIVLGQSKKKRGGKVAVTIDMIPDKQPPAATRSPGKALWLYFLKIVKVDTQRLCWAEISRGKVRRNTSGLGTKVKKAKRILMVVHGIIGDTKDMARLGLEAKEAGLYDLVLTFDYENLNTPINETASKLKTKLLKAGLSAKHEFTILAHSMGGLVSRHFIENQQGNELVDRLILAGTPNLGSNFGKLADYISWCNKLLGLSGMAGLTVPYAASIIAFLQGVEQITVTLGQMNYDDSGDFLKTLENNSDPKIPYTLIAGNIGDYMAQNKDPGLADKFLDIVAKLFNGKTDNDIAVEVPSIKGVDEERTPSASTFDVACHHLNYFTHPAGADVIRMCLGMKV